MTLKQWVHDPIIFGNDPIFLKEGSWRLKGAPRKNQCLGVKTLNLKTSPFGGNKE